MKAVSLLERRFPLVGVLVAAVLGVLLVSWSGLTWCFAAAMIGASIILLPFRRQGALVLLLTAGTFACLQFWAWNDAPARKLALWLEGHQEEYAVEGIVASEPKVFRLGTAAFFMRVERIDGLSGGSAPVFLPVQVRVLWSGESPAYGDRVRFHGMAARPPLPRNPGFDYRLWLERHGIYTQFSIDPAEPGSIISRGHGNPVMSWALAARHRMESILTIDLKGAPMELGAIKGITLGVTDNTPEGFTDDFRFTGTMHLFAVSGLHVGMLAVMIWFVLMAVRLPRPWAVAVIIPLLFFYVAITGLKSGSIRSASMISILLVGSVLYRRAPSLNTLAAAALLQLAVDPNVLFSAGWQFSYSVVFAILAIAPPLEACMRSLHQPDPFLPRRLLTRRERLEFSTWKHLAGLFSVSTAAWIGSLIPTVAYFHLISLSAIGANLLAVPLAFAVLALGALSLLAGGFLPWIAGAFNNANWLVAKLLLVVVHTSALLPGGHWFVGYPGQSPAAITIFDLGGASCAAVESGGEFALVNAGRKRDAVRDILPFLEMRGANSVQRILITKSDAAHLGGVPEIAREIKVLSLALPSENHRSVTARNVTDSFATISTMLQAGVPFRLLRDVEGEVLFQSDDASALMIRCGCTRILFLSKPTPDALRQLLSMLPGESLRAEVLVLPLGGSEIASTLQLIRKISPRVLVSPVDSWNRNGVPNPEWDRLLTNEGIELFRQDKTGAVIIGLAARQATITAFLGKKERTLRAP